MGYTKLNDLEGVVGGEEIKKGSSEKTWRKYLRTKQRKRYEGIAQEKEERGGGSSVTQNNSSPRKEKSGSDRNLDQIQNELFVRRDGGVGAPNKLHPSLEGNESASFPPSPHRRPEPLAKSRAAAEDPPTPCQQFGCKKFLRRLQKVLLRETRRQLSTEHHQLDEDIYVEVNQLAQHSYLKQDNKSDKMQKEMWSRIEGGGSSSTKGGKASRPAHLLYSNAIHNQNIMNNNNNSDRSASRSSLMASQNFINNNHTSSTGNLSRSVDNCWTDPSRRRFCNGEVVVSPSSEDNSPTELNSSRKFIEKPPLVKRLTMALVLKSSEESRPLMSSSQNSNLNSNYKTSSTKGSCQSIFGTGSGTGTGGCGEAGYVNEGICDLDQIISSKFGDSCRKSLMSMGNHHEAINWSIDHLNNQEFNFKKHLRETSSANSSPKIFSKPFRGTQHMNYSEQQDLKDASWFQAGIPRDISLEVLSKQSPGAFIVRNSNSKPGCFVLSLRVSPPLPKVAHYLILRTSRGYKIKGFTKEFTSLRALITHHSVMPELLPVPLALPRPKDIPARRNANDFDTYESLSDFQKLMTDLNDNLKLSTLVL